MRGKGGKVAACLAIPLAAALAVHLVMLTSPGQRFSIRGADLLAELLADPDRADSRIVLVEVDQGSLDFFEKDNIPFPWPRSLYNPLIEYCRAGGARAVLFDIMFNDQSTWGVEVDEDFAGAIREAGIVHLAAFLRKGAEGAAEVPPERFGLPYSGTPPPGLLRRSAVLPLPVILDAAAGVGSVAYNPDVDGISRRVIPFTVLDDRLVPALFSSPLVGGGDTGEFAPGLLRFAGMEIPLDSEGRMLVRFHGPRGTYRRYSAARLIQSAVRASEGLDAAVGAEEFRDAYVIVGYTAPGLFDLKPTPLSPVAPGMEIHAAALDNLLHGDFLREPPPWASPVLALMAGALTAAAIILLPSLSAMPAALAAAAGGFALSALAFREGVVLNLVSIELSLVLSLIGASVYRYQTEGKQRRFIAGAFGLYVSPKVVKQILDDPDRLSLGGGKRLITLFFSDLAGFTTIAESMPPQDLVPLMNDYLSVLSRTVMEREGTVVQYIGDAVMAFWGAPTDQEKHAAMALLAAVECQKRLKDFNDRLLAGGMPRLHTRIGLNTGECIVGNMGSRDRFGYTAVGDAVNQAARFEGLNKAYGSSIIASESTWQEGGGVVFGRQLDLVKVKGKKLPVRIYEVMAPAGEETAQMRFLRDGYEKALEAYREARWDDAEKAAAEILARHEDGAAKNILERVRHYRETPPPSDWDGSFTFLAK